MKSSSLFLFTLFFFFIIPCCLLQAQTGYEDVVYLKNGAIIHGMIVEQIPGVSVKIKTTDNNLFVFKMEEIEKITKEQTISKEQPGAGDKEPIRIEGRGYYKGNARLTKFDVERILAQCNVQTASLYWDKGQNQIVAGKVLIGLGIPITLLGVSASIGFAIDGALAPLIIMCVATPIGVGLTVGGSVSLSSGVKNTGRAIDTYNSSLHASTYHPKVSLSFGFAQTYPGVGMAIHF